MFSVQNGQSANEISCSIITIITRGKFDALYIAYLIRFNKVRSAYKQVYST